MSNSPLMRVNSIPTLLEYLRDTLEWPIDSMDIDDISFTYTPHELGLKEDEVAAVRGIRRLRPLVAGQPMTIFLVDMDSKRLKMQPLRRILSRVAAVNHRAMIVDQRTWKANDLIFLTNFGETENRKICLAHFTESAQKQRRLRVIEWDENDSPNKLSAISERMQNYLVWPKHLKDTEKWKSTWTAAFEYGYREQVAKAQQLARILADHAVAIRDRATETLDAETADGWLTKLYDQFKRSLLHTLTPSQFADMYAQSISYGLLSARITTHIRSEETFLASIKSNYFLGDLLASVITQAANDGPLDHFDELGVSDVVDLLEQTNIEAIVQEFDDKNPEDDPVIHFYESFLEAYDHSLKIKSGVFYTPRPIVQAIVRLADSAVREQFGLAHGLADTTTWDEYTRDNPTVEKPGSASGTDAVVQILDPATGTGTFLVEVIDLAHRRFMETPALREKFDSWSDYVDSHLLKIVFGFELMMAPYAIAHLKMALKLIETGYIPTQGKRRFNIYLTNSLEPADEETQGFNFAAPALALEATAVNAVKRKIAFSVVVGNPPYSNFSNYPRASWIQTLMQDYKANLNERKHNLDDDYIRFFRVAQHYLSNSPVKHLGYITNMSYFTAVTARIFRLVLLKQFANIKLLDLGGSLSEKTPGDENVFAGIRTAVGIFSGTSAPLSNEKIELAALLGKRREKFDAMEQSNLKFRQLSPVTPNHMFSVAPPQAGLWDSWPSLTELFPVYTSGAKTNIDEVFVGFTTDEVVAQVRSFIALSDDGLKPPTAIKRQKLAHSVRGEYINVVPYAYRPFDNRFIAYETAAFSDHRYNTFRHLDVSDFGIVSTRFLSSSKYQHSYAICAYPDMCIVSIKSKEAGYVFPNKIVNDGPLGSGDQNFNVAEKFFVGLSRADVMPYVYAVINSDLYRSMYFEGLRVGFPRIPDAPNGAVFDRLAQLGRALIALHTAPAKADGLVPRIEVLAPAEPVGAWEWSGAVLFGRTKKQGENVVQISELSVAMWEKEIGSIQVLRSWLKYRRGVPAGKIDWNWWLSVHQALEQAQVVVASIDQELAAAGLLK